VKNLKQGGLRQQAWVRFFASLRMTKPKLAPKLSRPLAQPYRKLTNQTTPKPQPSAIFAL
jgi:hypothetical protein